MDSSVPRSPFTGAPGWETPAEEDELMVRAQNVPEGGFIFEIGAEYGMSAAAFCKMAKPSVTIWSCDLFDVDGVLAQHRANLEAAGFKGRSRQVIGDSHAPDWAWPAPTGAAPDPRDVIDLLFIDGDHSVDGAFQDLKLFAHLVKVGGFMLIHDCACATNRMPHPSHYDVTLAVNRWYNTNEGVDWQLVQTVDSLMTFKRIS